MKCNYNFLLTILFSISSLFVFAQKSYVDSAMFISAISMNYTYQMPTGNIGKYYGNNSAVGTDFLLKFKNNILLGASYQYYFGKNIKNQETFFKDIKTTKGFVIDGNGQYAEIYLYERGFNLQAYGGYQFNIWSPNPNSGPFIQLGLGYLQYRVKIYNPDKTAPQVRGYYQKMYDRLRGGLSTSQFIGYRLISNRNLTNFYIGIEFTQAWTKSLRTFNADLPASETGTKLDMLTGIKMGIMVPFYKKKPNDYYYY